MSNGSGSASPEEDRLPRICFGLELELQLLLAHPMVQIHQSKRHRKVKRLVVGICSHETTSDRGRQTLQKRFVGLLKTYEK
jgi:hypothetical protein